MDHYSITTRETDFEFDFKFNDYFSRNVHLGYFDYKPYILNFFFGIFCLITPYEAEHLFTNHKFYVPDEEDRIRWILLYNESNSFYLELVNFYLDGNLTRSGAPLTRQEYDVLTNESLFKSGKIEGIWLNEFVVHSLRTTRSTLKLVVERIQQRDWDFDDRKDHSNGRKYEYMGINDDLFGAVENFSARFNYQRSELMFGAAESIWRSLNRSIYNHMDHIAVFGFVHGILYAVNAPTIVHHYQTNGNHSFFITRDKWSRKFTIAFLGDVPNANYIKTAEHVDPTCDEYSIIQLSHFSYDIRLPKNCHLDNRTIYHDNGEDYLENMFEHLKRLTAEKLERSDFVNYLSYVFEEVRPTNIRYDATTVNYLRFFIIGTFSSSKENAYEVKVHFFENVFIFVPKSTKYPFIILTLNTDYQRVSLRDLHDWSYNNSNPIFWVSINESFSKSDLLLTKRFLRRTVSITLVSQHQLAMDRIIYHNWIKLKRYELLDDLFKSKQNLNDILDLMEDVFGILYNADYRSSFHPFMHGLFYRSALLNLVRNKSTWFVKSMSQWTFTLAIFDRTNGWRNFIFYFLPNFEEIVKFVNIAEHPETEGSNLCHIFLVYDQINEELQSFVLQNVWLRDAIGLLAQSVCKLYSYYGKHFCKVYEKNSNSFLSYTYRLKEVRKYFSMPSSLARHVKLIDELSADVIEEYMDEKQIFNLTSQWFVNRSKKIRSFKRIHDQYLLGVNLRKLNINVTDSGMSTRDNDNIIAIASKESVGLTKFTITGTIDLPKLIDVMQSHSLYLRNIGKPALDALLSALTSKSKSTDPTDILQPLNEVLELSVWERTIDRFSNGFMSEHAVYRMETSSTAQGKKRFTLQFPHCSEELSIHTCERSRKCPGSIMQLSKRDSKSGNKSGYFNNVPAIHIFCRRRVFLPSSTVTIQGELNSTHALSYHCEKISVVYISTESEQANTDDKCTRELHNVDSGVPLYNFSRHRTTKFALLHGLPALEGGNGDDIFEFVFSLQCGSINGGPGQDTLKLNQYKSAEYELLIRSNSISYRVINDEQENNCVSLDSIERKIGLPNTTETVFVDCAFAMVSLNGGQPGYPDIIHIPQNVYCPDVISFVVRGHTVIRNMAQKGRYLYVISNLTSSTAVIYLKGRKGHIFHTLIIEYASVNEIASMSHEKGTIRIFDKSGGCLFLSIDGTFDSVELILKDGVKIVLSGKTLHIKFYDLENTMAALMDKYADMKLLNNVSLHIVSNQYAMNFHIKENTIQHGWGSKMPFKFVRAHLDGNNMSIECPSGQTYAVMLYTQESFLPGRTTIKTFVYRPSSNSSKESVHLIVDFSKFQSSNEFVQDPILNINLIENSAMLSLRGSVMINGTRHPHVICKLFFDGFDDQYKLNNIRILRILKLWPSIRTSPSLDGYDPKLTSHSNRLVGSNQTMYFSKALKKFWLVDNIIKIKPSDVDLNQGLTFPTIFLTNYETIRAKNHLLLTSIRSNIDDDIQKVNRNLFTLIIENYYTDSKMKTLKLKFGNGLILFTKNVTDYTYFHLIDSFQDHLWQIEQYLAEKEAKASIQMGYNGHKDMYQKGEEKRKKLFKKSSPSCYAGL